MLSTLTDEQRQVVIHQDGPAVVIACPGSGKTRALTHRMAHLVREGQVPAAQILGITFTKAAAKEMKDRLGALLGAAPTRQVRLFTFHGLAWRILRESSGTPNVLEGQAQQAMIRQILKTLDINADQTAVDGVVTDLACYVGGQVPRAEFEPRSLEPALFFQVLAEYTRLKTEAGRVDFDDLLIAARDLLTDQPQRRRDLVQGIRHLLVDEFQDTNALQWQFLQLLVPISKSLMVVGDDDQAIYGWRGASPAFMLNFTQEFPGAKQFHLSRNFRSAQSLLTPAAQLIARNAVRFPKLLQADRPPAHPPQFSRPQDPAEEADLLTATLKEYLSAQGNPAEAAVLYRTGMIAFPLINRMEKAGISFRILGGRPHPFSRWMVKDVLAYIRWSLGIASAEEVLRLLRRPSRWGISKEMLMEAERAAVPAPDLLTWLGKAAPPHGHRELKALAALLAQVAALPASKVISFIRNQIDYDRYISQYCIWSGSDPRDAWEVLSTLEQIPEPHEGPGAYLELASREVASSDEEQDGTPRITLSTLHSAKGLEWERVWLISAVEGAIPHRYTIESGSDAAMEEERRLLYVGLTRAKDSLYISAPQLMGGGTAAVSRFVVESGIWSPPPKRAKAKVKGRVAQPSPSLPPPLPHGDYAPGIICWHAQFQHGVIHRVDEQAGLVEVYFQSGAVRKVLSLDHCRLRQLLRVMPEGQGERFGPS